MITSGVPVSSHKDLSSQLTIYRSLCREKVYKCSQLRRLQQLESILLKHGILNASEADKRTARQSCYTVSFTSDGHLIDAVTGKDLDKVGHAYSLMKFGSAIDIQFFADRYFELFTNLFNDEKSSLRITFERAKKNHEYVAHLESGARNVEHSGFLIFDEAMRKINVFLALNSYPTIIRIRPHRLQVAPGNYASMTQAERANLAPATDHILPGKETYVHPIHIIFSDDVRITGATADKVEAETLSRGALSYQDFYLMSVIPEQALHQPELESKLNYLAFTGHLDDTMRGILIQSGFRPVQRLLRVLLNESNRSGLRAFLSSGIPSENIKRLYIAALNNDYLSDPTSCDSVIILREVAEGLGLIDEQGLPTTKNFHY